jgi:hypothetical protein
MVGNRLSIQGYFPQKGSPTKHCTGLPTARFIGGYAPTKMPLVEAYLADSAAGECWALGGFQRNCKRRQFTAYHL